MKLFALTVPALAAAFILTAVPANAPAPASATEAATTQNLSAAKAKPKSTAKRKARRSRATGGQAQIACTIDGCHPVPRNCTPEPGRYWSGMTTGFDVVVCR